MRNILIIIWLIAVGLLSYLSYRFCCNSTSNTTETVTTAVGENSGLFTISGDDWSTDCSYGSFVKSNQALIQEKDIFTDCFNEIAKYQKNHPNQHWTITGKYAEDETNNSIYANLGEARAVNIKNWLARDFGIPANMMHTKGELIDGANFVNDTLQNGYHIAVAEAPAAPVEVETFDNTKPIVLRFDLGSDIPNMDNDIRTRFARLITALENNPEKHLLLTGHTDKKGSEEDNMTLGMERAETVKQYLMRNGIGENRIDTESKGETMPISDDDALNRRVEVKIKN